MDPITRLNAALEGRYRLVGLMSYAPREAGGMSTDRSGLRRLRIHCARGLVCAASFPLTLGACGSGDSDPLEPFELPPLVSYWNDFDPAWSPDGSKIAIRSNRHDSLSPGHQGNTDLYLLDTLGNAVRLTTGLNASSPTWSPDSIRLAFSSGQSLWVVDRDGSNLTELLATNRPVSSPAWSPTGETIAFGRVECETCGVVYISVFDIATSSVTRITPEERAAQLSWSPDGAQAVYLRFLATSHQIIRMEADGSDPVLLFEDTEILERPAWSPCGTEIAFSSTASPSQLLKVMDADGSNVRVLTKGEQPSWSPDCSRIAFIRPSGNQGVAAWVIGTDGSGARKLSRQ